MNKFGVVGSCQVFGVASCLRVLAPGCTAHPLNAGAIATMSEQEQNALADTLKSCDVVFVEAVDRIKTGPLSNDALSAHVRIVRYPVVVYTGLHPDCIYVYHHGRTVQTHMGPYNSALIMAAFKEGLSVERTERLFNRFTFASLGYLAQNYASREEMLRTFESLGFRSDASIDRLFMHSINHPKIEVLQDVARQLLDVIGLKAISTAEMPQDTLKEGAIWPLYADLPWGTSYLFRGHANKGENRNMDLRSFIETSFAQYSKEPSAITAPTVERAQVFIQKQVR